MFYALLSFFYILTSLISGFVPPASAQETYAPSVDDIFISDSIDTYSDTYTTTAPLIPTIGGIKTIYANGHVSDLDGVGTGLADGNLAQVHGIFYRSNQGAGCLPSGNNCYTIECTLTPNSGTTLAFSCAFPIKYYAESTQEGSQYANDTWTAEVVVTDDENQIGAQSKQTEVQSILSLLIPSAMGYGTFSSAGETTTALTNLEYPITQQGNQIADVEVSGGDMSCSISGFIPVQNQEWSLIDVDAHAQATTPLTVSPVTVPLMVGYASDENDPTIKNLYWNITIPDVIAGECTGSNEINAIVHIEE